MKTEKFFIGKENYKISCKLYLKSAPSTVIVGVHGFGGDKNSSALSGLAKAMPEDFALICFDLPAHGQSNAHDGELTLSNCIDDLTRVFEYASERFSGARICVFATSFGGYISLLSLGRITPYKLVLRAPAVRMAKVLREKLFGDSFDAFKNSGYAVCGFERKFLLSYGVYEELAENDAMAVSPDMETLLFCAGRDELIDIDDLCEFASKNPTVKPVTLESAGHRFKGKGEIETVISQTVEFLKG